MSGKNFLIFKLIVVMILAGVISSFITIGNYIVPLLAMLVAVLMLYFLKKNVKDVMEDERDYEIAGKSARYTITFIGLFGGIAIIMLFALRDLNPYFELIGSVLAYIICLMLICYSLLFKYFSLPTDNRKRYILLTVIIIILFCLIFLGLRLFSGEDSWICDNGQWVEHGHPDYPAPTKPCK